MAEEELVTSPVPEPDPDPALTDHHKRKLEDLDAPAPELITQSPDKAVSDPDSSKNNAEEVLNGGADELEPKRPRLEPNVTEPDGLVSQNGHQEEEKGGELKDEEIEQSEAVIDNGELVLDSHELVKESLENVAEEPASNEGAEADNVEEPDQPKAEVEEYSKELPDENYVPSDELQSVSGTQIISRQMEVPNDKVGVLIGKAGDTIRSLQDNSGAKIQIVKDAEADPQATTRPLELIGTLESITRAEKLIKAVIAEADAGGSPSLVARGFNTVQVAGGGEQLEIQVPIEKVGIIIGKGGETIRNLQTRSGARIQLIQQNFSEGIQPTERTVRVSGNKKQIEAATDMIKDVMNQTSRPSSHSSGYGQHSSRPRGPVASQWGSRGPHHGQFSGYEYPQRGPYPSQSSQYPYGNYTAQQGPRSNFSSSWEQRPNARGPPPQGNYNYGQGPDYGHPPHYSQTPAQPYGHGYNEVKYDHHSTQQHFGHMGPQQTPYAQSGAQSGYGPQDQYGKPPVYSMPPQGTHPQQYGQPRPSQPGVMPHQGTQSYGQNVPSQQPYQYPTSGQMQQNYPPYGSTVSSDGYSHAAPAMTPASGYPAQGGQLVAGYGQQPPTYPQSGATGGYSSYPAAQTGYAEQPAAANTGYGYQGQADAAYGGQVGAYAQPSQTQSTYDQSGGYGSAPVAAAYATSASPQASTAYPQQYDSSQPYVAQHR
ncbi:far upstream element-binding protein 1-like [Dorcoceras hygrometricum]|uniref:Far upstream element-binding protein 1-like n=1 Tax=Dorcoceras hygrometricum TaxID=472368 RepID=A0A2Z7CUY3_9LAMI|nr:far upstream element-binding protein 1-like [Dorcoceras hygrometricum]